MHYYRDAITVGYYPNPNLDKIPYESSLSPTIILTQDALSSLAASGLNNLEKYNYNFIITESQSFYTPNYFNLPLENEVKLLIKLL